MTHVVMSLISQQDCGFFPSAYLYPAAQKPALLQFYCGSLVAKSCLTLVTPWTVAHQTSPSVGFSQQEYWSGLPCPPPGDPPHPGIELWSPALQADSLPTELQGKPAVLTRLCQNHLTGAKIRFLHSHTGVRQRQRWRFLDFILN